MSPIPSTVERDSYFSLIFSLLLSLFLSLSLLFFFFSPWFLLSLPASFVVLLKEKEESCCLQLDIKYHSRENAMMRVSATWPTTK